MTSADFALVRVNDIIVPEDRQRKDFGDIEALASSIRARGLIHPIVIQRDNTLVAGERRLRAHQLLQFQMIAVQYTDQLDPAELRLIELEENIKRKELTWQEHNDAVCDYHAANKELDPTWSAERTAEILNLSARNVGRELMVKKAREEGVKEVNEAPTFSTAANFAQRRSERRRAASKNEVSDILEASLKPKVAPKEISEEEIAATPAKPSRRRADIIEANFKQWAAGSHSTFYNFIHCDFPYGINATKIGQSSAKSFGGYEDTPEIYWKLLDTLTTYQDAFIAPQAHLVFWFSMNFFQKTKEKLEAANWVVNPFPLIWHRSDGKGIIPDTNRYGRRTYETALFCTRGDRKIVSPVPISYSGRTTKDYHTSEKPHGMLEHFFRMIVDESTIMLDPTAGSGMAVKVAEERGAKWALGLELNPDYVAGARDNLKL